MSSFEELIWRVLDSADLDTTQKFSVILTGIWHSRNKKLWNNIFVSASATVYRTLDKLFS